MFDVAWTELLLLAILAVVVIGPKDLPRVMRTLGRTVGKARAMAHEFRLGFDQLAREAELEELREAANKAAALDPRRMVGEALAAPDKADQGGKDGQAEAGQADG
ncbi:MAG: Sec-independent protein translocase protein TatB [Pseudomonadota bacterium]|jgi:sec-independent protein translocase protein TatB